MVRAAGIEAEFGEVVLQAEIAAEEADLPAAAEPTEGETSLLTELGPTIHTAPRAAVIEAWLAVQQEIEALAEQEGFDLPERGPYGRPQAAIARLRAQGVIDDELARVIQDLSRARNLAAHAPSYDVPPSEVAEYVKLAGRVRSALRLARQSQEAAMEGRTGYDLLVYHDLSDSTKTRGGAVPKVGDKADNWFGERIGGDRHVVAVGPGVHDGRVTVMLAHGNRPMARLQALLDPLAEQ